MTLPDQTADILLVVGLGVSAVLAIVVALLAVRLGRLRASYAAALDPDRGEDVFAALERLGGDVDGIRTDLGVVHDNTEHLRELLAGTVSQVGIVRYDAFEDMGGALSFSAALLDEHGDGLVISAINGRSETRCYAKPVVGGDSEHNLSREELAAIDAARRGERAGVVASSRRRGRRARAS